MSFIDLPTLFSAIVIFSDDHEPFQHAEAVTKEMDDGL